MHRAVILVFVLSALGCGGVRYVPMRYFAVYPEIAIERMQATDRTIGMRPLLAGRMHNERMLFVADGNAVDAYPHAAWTDMPRDVVGKALLDALTATHRFRDVGDAADMRSPTYLLTGELRRFEEVRTAGKASALCEVRLELRSFGDRDLIWADAVSATEPMSCEGPAALTEAMTKAVARVARDAASQIASK